VGPTPGPGRHELVVLEQGGHRGRDLRGAVGADGDRVAAPELRLRSAAVGAVEDGLAGAAAGARLQALPPLAAAGEEDLVAGVERRGIDLGDRAPGLGFRRAVAG